MKDSQMPQWFVDFNVWYLETVGQYGFYATLCIISIVLGATIAILCEKYERRKNR